MISVGATVYIAPGVERVEYLAKGIKAGRLILGAHMMGKVTRYSNSGDKIGIQFEYKIWSSDGPSNHGTGNAGYCAYIPAEYVRVIPELKVEYFRENIATRISTLSTGKYLTTIKLGKAQQEILSSWHQSYTLGTNGYPELPVVREITNNSFGSPPPPKENPVWFDEANKWKVEMIEEERIANQRQFNRDYQQEYIAGINPYQAYSYPVVAGRTSRGKSDMAMAMQMAMMATQYTIFKLTHPPLDSEIELLTI